MKMILNIKRVIKKLLGYPVEIVEDKQESEARFWRSEIDNYVKWYNGEIKSIYDTPCPVNDAKLVVSNIKDSAILTWHKYHQEIKYLTDLNVKSDFFRNNRILDIGAGPMPSATCFEGADLYCLEPLLDRYLKIGFPIHYYGNVKFVHACSEKIPIEANFFDAVISVNAMDHVDDFERTALEIIRVLKPEGIVIFHLHYHLATQNEPLELNDERVSKAFEGLTSFRKILESKEKMGYKCGDNESYSVWTNSK